MRKHAGQLLCCMPRLSPNQISSYPRAFFCVPLVLFNIYSIRFSQNSCARTGIWREYVYIIHHITCVWRPKAAGDEGCANRMGNSETECTLHSTVQLTTHWFMHALVHCLAIQWTCDDRRLSPWMFVSKISTFIIIDSARATPFSRAYVATHIRKCITVDFPLFTQCPTNVWLLLFDYIIGGCSRAETTCWTVAHICMFRWLSGYMLTFVWTLWKMSAA